MDYSVNTNPFGPPKIIITKIKKEYKNLSSNTYGKEYTAAFEKAKEFLAGYHSVKAENLLFGSGCSELINLALQTLKPRRVLVPAPSSELYFTACKQKGGEVIPLILDKAKDFDLDPDELILKAQGVDAIILANPNNPTSRIIEKGKLQKILDYCQEKGIYLIIDEAYADFVSSDISAVKHISRYANIVIIKTLANYFSLGGLRFAYAIACNSLLELMRSNQLPGTVNYISLIAYEALLKDVKYIRKTKNWLMTEPKRFFHIVSTLGGITAYKPYANYIFIGLEQIPSATLCERLAAKGVAVKNCNRAFGQDGQYIRIAIKDKRSNNKFLDAFSRCLL